MAFCTPYTRAARRSHPFFPSFQQDFAPIFRVFDELENVSRTSVRQFQPRFDVREEKDAFHLQGELPGVDQKDINIEFVDPTTLVIRGRTVREHQAGTPPAALEQSQTKSIDNAAEQAEETSVAPEGTATPQSETSGNYKRPSIEEERDEAETSTVGAPTPATTNAELAQPAETSEPEQQVSKATKEKSHHYWVSERTIGQFHRSFNFPGQVDQDAVTANLKNGILSIVVPKQQPKQPRKITVE